MAEKNISSRSGRLLLRFDQRHRLKKSYEFQAVFEKHLSSADNRLIVYARSNQLSRSRLGISAGRRLGCAVRRNRYRRTLREAFRLLQHELPAGYDYVLIPRPAQSVSTELYRKSLLEICHRLHKRSQKIKKKSKTED